MGSYLLVVVAVLCFVCANAQNTCQKLQASMFCTNVDWLVDQTVTNQIIAAHAELQIEMVVVNFEGSRKCKNWYKELQCRFAYPICTFSANKVTSTRPCRSECESFAAACPGAMQACAAYPTDNCYTFSAPSSAAHSSSPSALIVLAVFAAFMALCAWKC